MSDETDSSAARGNGDPVTCESEPQGSEKSKDDSAVPLPGLKAWMSALQVVSLLAAIGFVAKLAHEQMLGIELTDWSALDLSLFAGRWIVDTLTILLDVLSHDHYLDLAVIVLALLPALAMIFMQEYPRLLRAARFVGVGLSAVLLSFLIVHYEMPTIALSNWLTADLTQLANPVHGGKRGSREEVVRYTYFMSKTNVANESDLQNIRNAIIASYQGNASADSKDLASITDSLNHQAAVKFGDLLLKSPITSSDAQEKLQSWYSHAFWICAVTLLTLIVFVVKGGKDLEDELLSALYYFTAFILLPVGCALLPYMYGKLIASSEFPQATVITSAPKAEGSDSPVRDDATGVLIEQSEKGYKLLTVNNGATLLQIYTDPSVKLNIKPDSNQDVVRYVLNSKAIAAAPAR